MIPAGRLRHRITLQQPSTTTDAAGSVIASFTDAGSVWAECLQMNGRELLAVQAKGSKATWRITIRWRGDISPRWRILFGTRVLELVEVADLDGRRRLLRLEAEETHVQ